MMAGFNPDDLALRHAVVFIQEAMGDTEATDGS